MDINKILALMDAMRRRGITRLSLKEGTGDSLELEYGQQATFPQVDHFSAPPPQPPLPTANLQETEGSFQPEKGSSRSEFITSPMVGTFYASSSAEALPLVERGTVVNEESVVCIIESMKVMNEVKAGMKGKITEVLVEHGSPVEFDTQLFQVSVES